MVSGGSFGVEYIGTFLGSLAVLIGGPGREMCNSSSARRYYFQRRLLSKHISSFYYFFKGYVQILLFFFLLSCPVLVNVGQLQLKLNVWKNLLP